MTRYDYRAAMVCLAGVAIVLGACEAQQELSNSKNMACYPDSNSYDDGDNTFNADNTDTHPPPMLTGDEWTMEG